jgi:antitoxin ParD1/3/4
VPTRNINLTDHLDTLIESSIASGHYKNASEVVRDGLRLLEQRQQEDKAKLKRLRAEVQVGLDALDRGNYVEVDEDGLRSLITDLGRQAGERAKARRSRP